MAARKPPDDPGNVVALRPGSGRGAGNTTASGGTRGKKASVRTLTVEQRRMTALELRKRGLSFTNIAAAIREQYPDAAGPNYDYKRAHDDVRECIERISTSTIMEYVEESAARCMGYISALVPNIQAGDPAAIQAAVAVERRLASLLGMDAARRIALTGPDGGPVQIMTAPITDHDEAVAAVDAAIEAVLGRKAE